MATTRFGGGNETQCATVQKPLFALLFPSFSSLCGLESTTMKTGEKVAPQLSTCGQSDMPDQSNGGRERMPVGEISPCFAARNRVMPLSTVALSFLGGSSPCSVVHRESGKPRNNASTPCYSSDVAQRPLLLLEHVHRVRLPHSTYSCTCASGMDYLPLPLREGSSLHRRYME